MTVKVHIIIKGSAIRIVMNSQMRMAERRVKNRTEQTAAPKWRPPYSYNFARERRTRRGNQKGMNQVSLNRVLST